MKDQQNLFSSFSSVSAKAWKAKVEKELKGSPWEDLFWHLGALGKIAPFYLADELPADYAPLAFDRPDNDWEIGENILIKTPKQANALALHALKNGVNAPCFIWPQQADTADLPQLLQHIEAEYISLHFQTERADLDLLEAFYQLQQTKGKSTANLRGSFSFNFQAEPEKSWSVLRFAENHLPHFKVITIDGSDLNQGPEQVSGELTALLHRACQVLTAAQANGIEFQAAASRMQFAVVVGTSYFVEMAKLRALQLLWPLLLEGFGVTQPPAISIYTQLNPASQIEDQNLNMIRASTQAMSAVLGGANRLTILPADAFSQTENDFTRRISRNVQHLLKMESYLDRVADPAAGSYYMETLTNVLAEQAWEQFRESQSK